jgi:hypothetical protein
VTKDLERSVVSLGLDDWVPLAAVEGLVRQRGETDERRILEVTLQVLRSLAEGGLATIGTLQDGGCIPSEERTDLLLDQLSIAMNTASVTQWGFGWWLDNTELGDEVARGANGP